MKNLLIVFIFLQSCTTQKPISITEFFTYAKPVDSTLSLGKIRVYYNNFFLITNYKDNLKSQNKLDSFAINYILQNKYAAKTEEVRLWFYKESTRTNLIEIKKNPREVDRYSNQHDLIYGYYIKRDEENIREKYKNGNVIETTDKYIPTPKFKMILLEN